MSRPHIFIATPLAFQQVWFSYHRSLLATMLALPRHGIDVTDGPLLGCSSIPHARCILQAQFLRNPEYTHLMWIDWDIGWNWKDIVRMVATGRELVSGVYQMRSDPPRFPILFPTQDPVMEPDGCVETETIMGGFVLVKREAIERMTRKLPECRVKLSAGEWNDPDNRDMWNFYPLSMTESIMNSDDGGFSELYRKAGGTLHVMPEIRLTHCGVKEYGACLADHVNFRKREAA